eukprot:FR740052.1.p5 GENE.FR740052.1~~FR740052.1.p5  ORF type:complete len:116 (+),score=71.90 FR740052.1:756-1103(+)
MVANKDFNLPQSPRGTLVFQGHKPLCGFSRKLPGMGGMGGNWPLEKGFYPKKQNSRGANKKRKKNLNFPPCQNFKGKNQGPKKKTPKFSKKGAPPPRGGKNPPPFLFSPFLRGGG